MSQPADVADGRAGSAWCNAQATCCSENVDRFIWRLLWWAEGPPSPALSRFGVPSISGIHHLEPVVGCLLDLRVARLEESRALLGPQRSE
jgi:hypothetical protein